LLGDTNQEEATEPRKNQKQQKEITRLLKLEPRERNESYVYSE
jgi:hypothetical protein